MNKNPSSLHQSVNQPWNDSLTTVPFLPIQANDLILGNHDRYSNQIINIPLYSDFTSVAEVELHMHMRVLWNEQISRTRMMIACFIFKLPNLDAVTNWLFQHATQMGEAFKPFYGNQIREVYEKLIHEHLATGADLIKASVVKNQTLFTINNHEWYTNADDIVTFLNNINPFIELEEARELFYMYLDGIKIEMTSMMKKEYETDVTVDDELQKRAEEIADILTEGIIKQFPDQFI